MKRYLIFSIGFALMLFLALPLQTVKAQIYGEFDPITIEVQTYQQLTAATEVFYTQFTMPPTNQLNWDDGYYLLRFKSGFEFEFNGEVYTQLWICVNGFVTFSDRPYLPAKNSSGLFGDAVSFPKNVIAPYWGDHFLRTSDDEKRGYLRSRIFYRNDDDKLIIEWRNLNINDSTVKSSVGNFQLILYKSTDPLSKQGDIEFAYGQVGGNPNDPSTVVVTKNASVGLKGESTIKKDVADFINGLYNGAIYPYNKDNARNNTNLTNEWTPSGGTDKRIRFHALTRYNIEEWWGDGDADMSKGKGQKHENMAQNRYVTMNDARVIMHSISTGTPLDSIRRRNAYHGDVNHNGRYFYFQYAYTVKLKKYHLPGQPALDSIDLVTGNKVYKVLNFVKRYDIPWRTMNYFDSLLYIVHVDNYHFQNQYTDTVITVNAIVPSGISSLKRVYYQVTEYDAAQIIQYMGCKLPTLPWIYDTTIWHGKIGVGDKVADNLIFGNVENLGNGEYRLPVYLNGYANGSIAGKFDIGSKITDVSVLKNESNVLETEMNNNRFVFAGMGEFDGSAHLFVITFKSESPVINITGIRYNDNNKENVAIDLPMTNNQPINPVEILEQNAPNPVITNTVFTMNLQRDGNYELSIFDTFGNKVKHFNTEFKAGVNLLNWNGTDDNGNKLVPGMYIYKLTGDNLSLSKKLVIVK